MRALAICALVVSVVPGCGGGDDGDVLGELAALPGVDVDEVFPEDAPAGVRFFDLYFDQPVDHTQPGGATFRQYAALIHVDPDAPMVVYTSGYGAGRTRSPSEPTALVGGNQLSLEYRFYRSSLPTPLDWSMLDVEQASADFHHAVELLKPLYPAPWLNTGGSKGGETTLHSRFLYPDDYAGSVAYVTPVRLGNPDLRYAGILDAIGEPGCRDRLRAVQRALLERRPAMVARLEASGDPYTQLGADFAFEIAVVEVEWAFWQYRGIDACPDVPADAAAADDDTLFTFLDDTSPPSGYDDASLADSYGPFTYQCMTQLGYPIFDHDHLADLVVYDYQDLRPFLPDGVDGDALVLDPSFNTALLDWAATDATQVIIIDGQWDPWSGGAVTLSDDPAHDAHRYVVPQGSHGANIGRLPDAERADAQARVARWAGVSAPARE